MEMVKKVLVSLIDDFDGKPADETVQFGLDGVSYEIDLSAKNAKKLREHLQPWVNAGRRTGGSISWLATSSQEYLVHLNAQCMVGTFRVHDTLQHRIT